MNSCHEESVRDWDRAGIEATSQPMCQHYVGYSRTPPF
eukprot:gene26511-biopygen16714